MSDFVSIIIDDRQLRHALDRLAAAGRDTTPAMRQIAGALANITEDNFAAEGRPRWKPSQRASNEGGVTLQDSGQLAASISTSYDANSATIGSNLPYARIHQFGGKAGRGGSVELPARPYLPLTAQGELQPEAREAVLAITLKHLKSAAGF